MSRISKYLALGLGFPVIIVLSIFTLATASNAYAEHAFREKAPQNPQFSELLRDYRFLIEKVGPRKAQDILRETLPADSRGHFLAHEAGSYLYTHEGVAGLAGCANYFANACFHGFLIAMTEDRGTDSAGSLYEACAQNLARSQSLDCAHGLGHAFLQYIGYEHLPKALDLCKSTFERDQEAREYCYGGVFMDNNFGEFNTPPPDRWYKENDPMYPCNAPETLAYEGAHERCWFMQSQGLLNEYAYPQFKGDVRTASRYCVELSGEDRTQCFHGMSMSIQQKAGNALSNIRAQCNEMPAIRSAQCIWDAVGAGYYYGDRGADSNAYSICSDENSTSTCLETIYSYMVSSFAKLEDRLRACAHFSAPTRNSCENYMRTASDESYAPH